MITRAEIDDFVGQKSLALVGVSRKGRGFGNTVRKELTARGYALRLIHPEAASIDGRPCARTLAEVASEVGGAILVTPPESTTTLVKEAADAGIRRLWLQQGAESDEAIRLAKERGLSVIHGQCILMYAEPTGFPHNLHRFILRLFGRLPR